MNIVEKILASHSNRKSVTPGEIIDAKVDLVLANDLSAFPAIEEFKKVGTKRVFDRKKIAIVFDHFVPAKDIRTATLCKNIKKWVREQGIVNFFDVGKGGIEHIILPDSGLILPGEIIIGGDSHTITYGALGAAGIGVGSTDIAATFITGRIWLKVPGCIKIHFSGKLPKWVSAKDLALFTIGKIGVEGARYKAIEFAGDTIKNLDMAGRFTLCNMATEMGAKIGIIEPDKKTEEFLNKVATKKFETIKNDSDAHYSMVYKFEVGEMEPMIACPSSPEKVVPISKIGNIKIDQVLIGSCTNGRLEDLKIAADILEGKKICRDVRLIVIPGSQDIYLEAIKRGIIEKFVRAGAVVSTPSCGPCIGGHLGVITEGEICLSTTNRNFVGRMGHIKSNVYLSSPAVAAASAIAGKIAGPKKGL